MKKKVAIIFICILLLPVAALLPAGYTNAANDVLTAGSAEESTSYPHTEDTITSIKTITLPIKVTATDKTVDWDFTYSDSWFNNPSDKYDHNIARVSLGLACASFRVTTDGDKEPGENLYKALTDAGFKDIRSDDYDKTPTLFTVATEMGHKTITDEGEPCELIAVAVCSGGYQNEWLSNLTVGDEERHEGFNSAAGEVYDRIFGYIARQHLKGRIKIWLTGFSRGAAVSNITGADLNDSGIFLPEDIYVYTFATPNTTQAETTADYSNIFNIAGKNDTVPKVPFSDWGFTRYGDTLSIPSVQADSDYSDKEAKANVIYRQLTGMDLWDTTGIEHELHTLMGCMDKMVPNTSTYANNLQSRVIGVWNTQSFINILKTMIRISEDPNLVNETNKWEVNSMLDYLSFSALGMILKNGTLAESWNENTGIIANLMFDHSPEVYLSWMFSADDPDKIFSDSYSYTRVVIDGEATVCLSDASKKYVDSEFTKVIDSSGIRLSEYTVTDETGEQVTISSADTDNCGYISAGEGRTLLILPRDNAYVISVYPDYEQDITISCTELSSINVMPVLSKENTVHLTEGSSTMVMLNDLQNWGQDVLISSTEITNIDFDSLGYPDVMSSLIQMESRNSVTLQWRTFVILVVTLPVVGIALMVYIICLMTGIFRWRYNRKRGKAYYTGRYNPIPLICLVAMYCMWPVTELYGGLLPNEKGGIAIRTAITGLMAVLIILLRFLRTKRIPHLIEMGGVFFAVVGSIVSVFSWEIAMIVFIISTACMCAASFIREKPTKMQYIIWGIISAILIIPLFVFGNYGLLARFIAAFLVAFLAFTGVTALTDPLKTRLGEYAFIVFNILFIIFNIIGMKFIPHLITMGVFYIALGIISTSLPDGIDQDPYDEYDDTDDDFFYSFHGGSGFGTSKEADDKGPISFDEL